MSFPLFLRKSQNVKKIVEYEICENRIFEKRSLSRSLRFEKSMPVMFSVERTFFSFLLELCDFYKQLVEIFHAEFL